MKFVKVIDIPEYDTQVIIRKEENFDDEDSYPYYIIIESRLDYEDFKVEPKATLKYETEEKRDEIFDTKDYKSIAITTIEESIKMIEKSTDIKYK